MTRRALSLVDELRAEAKKKSNGSCGMTLLDDATREAIWIVARDSEVGIDPLVASLRNRNIRVGRETVRKIRDGKGCASCDCPAQRAAK